MQDSQEPGIQETFISHLIELRSRVVKSTVVVLAVFCVLYFVWPGPAAVYDFIAQPMLDALPAGSKMIAIGTVTPFLVPMKLTFLAALLLSLPWVLYQVWAFVAPGLYAHEKRLIAPLVISSSALFMGGAAFCYFFVFGKVFHFISSMAPTSITVAPDIENYVDFVMTMCIAFGASFEVPVVVAVLVRMNLVTVEKLRAIRSYVIVGAFVVAAIVTPPDIPSQLFLATAMCLLYEVGLLVAPWFARATRQAEDPA
jgi:sec-independent protein translocase protein TatC